MVEKKHLKAAGLKITTPRMRILDLLSHSESQHISAEEIYQQLSHIDNEISLATIYRVLSQFEEAGLVIQHRFSEHRRVFELNQGEHHDHLVCIECRKIIEFQDDFIESRQKQLAETFNFTMTAHSLTLYGLCSDCSKHSHRPFNASDK